MGPILVDPRQPDTLYLAGQDGFESSDDGGESWRQLGAISGGNKGLPEGVSGVAVSPSNPQVLYAGMLDGESARVFRSEDGGENWQAQN
jgi:photosystem II stability/assembly factor-like uncharacterized protein